MYIHTYLNYVNLSWGSTNRTNLKKLLSQQKRTVRIINNKTRFDHTNELFKSQKILNIYKLNILSVAVFMYQIRNKTAPLTFSGGFEKICHRYPTHFSQFNYKIPKTALSKSKFKISFRGTSIWNNILQNFEKEIESLLLFKSKLKLKLKLLSFSNEITYFSNISTVSWQHLVDEKGLDGKAIVAFYESFLVSKTNINFIIYN